MTSWFIVLRFCLCALSRSKFVPKRYVFEVLVYDTSGATNTASDNNKHVAWRIHSLFSVQRNRLQWSHTFHFAKLNLLVKFVKIVHLIFLKENCEFVFQKNKLHHQNVIRPNHWSRGEFNNLSNFLLCVCVFDWYESGAVVNIFFVCSHRWDGNFFSVNTPRFHAFLTLAQKENNNRYIIKKEKWIKSQYYHATLDLPSINDKKWI